MSCNGERGIKADQAAVGIMDVAGQKFGELKVVSETLEDRCQHALHGPGDYGEVDAEPARPRIYFVS